MFNVWGGCWYSPEGNCFCVNRQFYIWEYDFFLLQLQEVLLSYIANPQLELALVILIVPFIVNVSDLALTYCLKKKKTTSSLISAALVNPVSSMWCPLVVHHVLGGGQPDDEEVQDAEEPGRLLWQLGEEGWLTALGERRGVTGENNWMLTAGYCVKLSASVQAWPVDLLSLDLHLEKDVDRGL